MKHKKSIIDYYRQLRGIARGNLFSALIPLSSNLSNLFLARPDSLAPFYVSWLLTYGCNCRCSHCDWVWSKTNKDDLNRELTPQRRLEVAQQIGESKTWGVSLSGGEPLVVPGVLEIISRLKAGGKMVNLDTNGVRLSFFAKDLTDLGVDSITVSLDSHCPKVHDSLRGREGTFAAALEGIRAIRHSRSVKKTKLSVKCVIAPFNIKYLADYMNYFKPLVDSIGFQPIQDNLGHQVKEKSLLFLPEHESDFRQAIESLIKGWPEFDNLYYRYMADFIFHPDELFTSIGYRDLFNSSCSVAIDPYGDLVHNGYISIGSIREKSFLEIWRSKNNFQIQRKMHTGEIKCISWTYGSILNSYLLPIYKKIPWLEKL